MAEKDDAQDQPEAGDTGMEKGDMKRLLKRAQSKPVSCALAQGDPKEGSLGLLLMDKMKQPKQLVRSLKEKFAELRTPVFGTATADPEAKLVTFTLNKKIAGMDRRIRKTLKGTGYNKVAIASGAAAPGADEP